MEFSIVICTYNPVREILLRAVNSCISQTVKADTYEIIIIDNNSLLPLSALDYIKAILKNNCNVTLHQEKTQGLIHARINGIQKTNSQTIIFVDDDNVLENSYLENLKSLLKNYEQVAIWGPGQIEPDYVNGVPKWIEKHFSGLYQKKNKTETRFGCEIEWTDYYPAGSGLVVLKKVLVKYINDFKNGKVSAIGRKGNELSSAEDSQIIWTAIKMGYSVGTSPVLKLTHIIPGNRTNLNYLKKLNYGISNSYYKALTEMFPDYILKYKKRNIISKIALGWRMLLKAKMDPLLCYRLYKVENSWLKGYDDYLTNL